ncbi:unnamed protein product, partial [Medioppia subpectinata]
KAAKALLVLTPLLGVAYMLVLVTPTHRTAKLIFQYLQAILVSTQVRNSVRHHFERFKLRRTLRGGEYPVGQRNTFAFRSLRYGENVKLYRNRGERDRGSCISFSTTTTYVSNNHNQSKTRKPSTNGSVNNSSAIYGPIAGRKRSDEDVL